ncbi:hypothetical protein BKA66DRAFT_193310 [Pyrenochaeta sp. MPI-SDFR-AT-0127]|nr:hypothetical protein BKA66DRAFT_193310 [Pyrenochaeta sp. MPI-SDFR-AT-0127]
MVEFTPFTILAHLKSLLETGEYSDLTITCGDDTYHVHKLLVCSQSSFFKKAEKFPVGKEAAEAKIDLPEDEPAVVKLLIQFLYEGEYEPKLPDSEYRKADGSYTVTAPKVSRFHYQFPHTCRRGCPAPDYDVCPHHSCKHDTCKEKCENFICAVCTAPPPPDGGAAQLLLHAQLYESGDKYDIPALKHLAREKFDRAAKSFWNADEFSHAVEHACLTTPESDFGLRDIIINTISAHIELLNKPSIIQLLKTQTGLAYGVLLRRSRDMGWIKNVD